MTRKRLLGIIAACIVALFSIPASAVVVLDFQTGDPGTGGTITASPNNTSPTSVSGSSINIGLLIVDGTTSMDGSYTVNGSLDFDTNIDSITINGTIPTLGIDNPIALLSGSFDSWSFSTPGGNELFSASGPDTKAGDLLGALGVPTVGFEFFGISIESQNGTVISTDIVNTAVPIPAAVWLFSSGLLGLVGIARRKRNN